MTTLRTTAVHAVLGYELVKTVFARFAQTQNGPASQDFSLLDPDADSIFGKQYAVSGSVDIDLQSLTNFFGEAFGFDTAFTLWVQPDVDVVIKGSGWFFNDTDGINIPANGLWAHSSSIPYDVNPFVLTVEGTGNVLVVIQGESA